MKVKRFSVSLLSLLITVCLFLPIVSTYPVYAASYGDDYRLWNQANSDYQGMRESGCFIVAQAKMLYEANVTRDEMNPDFWYNWLLNQNCLNGMYLKDVGITAPVIYANYFNIDSSYIGKFTGQSNCSDDSIWRNIDAGYFTIGYLIET